MRDLMHFWKHRNWSGSWIEVKETHQTYGDYHTDFLFNGEAEGARTDRGKREAKEAIGGVDAADLEEAEHGRRSPIERASIDALRVSETGMLTPIVATKNGLCRRT